MKSTDSLARSSQYIAAAALVLVVAMLVLNTATWFFPALGQVDGGAGLSFSLTQRMVSMAGIDVAAMPWWQLLGAALISSIPLFAMAYGLLHLRALFQQYAGGSYFAHSAYGHMEKLGRAILAWVVLDFVCEPVLSLWLTMLAPVGQRMLTLSLEPPVFIALFLAACVIAIARILQRACDLHAENQQFV
ncbi:DUF2975 domain-containing protein [Comamonas sp. GB3 AK4-5]|uniref:DUF2975 domain-containing protein n=1 Tax=Comamonas sp. GB3 AK4-5 TaxID=3231487 RepID=UPI00351E7ABD